MNAGLLRRTLAAALLVVGVSAVLASPAAGHASQTGTSPESGAVLTTPPTRVVVTFDSPLMDIGAAMVVRSADGVGVMLDAPVIRRNSISVSTDPLAPDGIYTVAYRVVSQDGHTMTSTFSYTVGKPEAATSASPSATSLPAVSAEPTPPVDEARQTADPNAAEGLEIPLPVLIGALVAAAVAVVAVVVVRRRRSRPRPATER